MTGCVALNKFVVFTGGWFLNTMKMSGKILVFNTVTETWAHDYPELKTARYFHGSCAIKSTIYVYGGCNQLIESLNSLEWL